MALTKPSRGMLDTGISDSSDATALTFDSSEDATFTGHIVLADNKKIKFGDSTDYHISHNANGVTYVAGSVVEHNANTWRIKNLAGTESIINALADGAVTLYHNNAAKLATAADGIDVTGHIDAATITTTGAGTIGGNLTVTGNLQVDGTTTTINSTTYTVDDLNITLASGAGSSSAADGAGITIDGASATWNYTHSNTSWVANKNVRAPRFLTTSNSSSNFYSLLATRSGSGTSNPDLYGSSNTLVLGYSDSGKAVSFNATGADFAGTISSGAITSTGTLGITGAISSGADTTIASFGRAGSAVSSSIIYADATTDMEFGTTTAHALSLITADTRRLTIDNSGNATFSANLTVNGNTTLGNADSDTVTIPGPVAVDTDTLYVDVTNDRVGINSGTSPSTALDVTGVISTDNLALGGATVANSYLIEATAGSGNIIRSTRGSSVFAAYQSNNSHVYLGTTSDNEFRIIQNDGTALTIDTDRHVGIGTTSPSYGLEVKSGTNNSSPYRVPIATFQSASYDQWLSITGDGSGAAGGMGIQYGRGTGVPEIFVTSGKVGIGMTSPLSQLTFESAHFNTGTEDGPSIRWNNGITTADSIIQNFEDANVAPFVFGMNSHIPSGGSFAAFNTSHPSSYIYMAASGRLLFGTNTSGTTTERMRINGNGNMFFGTTTEPSGMASSSYKQIKIGGGLLADSGHSSGHNILLANNVHVGASNDLKFTHAAAASSVSLTGGKIYFRTHDGGGASADATASLNQRMMIHSNGRVRIGDTATPGTLLDVGNVTNQYPLKLRGNLDSSGGYSGITFGYESDTNAYEKARIRVEGTSGNVQPEFHVLIDHDASSSSAEKSDAMISVVSNTQGKKMVVIDAGKQGNSYDIDAPSSGEVLLVQGPIAAGRTAALGDAQGTTGRWVHNWWHGSTGNGSSYYTHIETDLWGGGSPSGNSQFIMGGFWIKGYQYGGGNLFAIHQFHNWSGSLYNHGVNDLGSWTGKTHVYVSSNGYVTLRLDSRGSYRMWDVDLVQYAQYNKRDISVRSETHNSASTI